MIEIIKCFPRSAEEPAASGIAGIPPAGRETWMRLETKKGALIFQGFVPLPKIPFYLFIFFLTATLKILRLIPLQSSFPAFYFPS